MRVRAGVIAMLLAISPAAAPRAQAQQNHESDPTTALTDALIAACRQNPEQFARYLTMENAAAFRNLPASEQAALLKRFALVDNPGTPLISNDQQGHNQLRCQAPEATTLFRFGAPRVHDNLAFIPVDAADGRKIEFGLVRQDGGWRMLSLGLLLLDIPQLEKQWALEDMEARERAAIRTLYALADAINTYRTGFEKLPESLVQLGPAPKEGASPDAAQLVDAQMAAGKKAGYLFRYRILPGAGGTDGFELAAAPAEYGRTGRRSFFLDANGKLHAADKQGDSATGNEPVIREGKPE